jgi:hypothetical protein
MIQHVLKAVSTCKLNLHSADIDTRNFIDTWQPHFFALLNTSTCLSQFCRTTWSVAQVNRFANIPWLLLIRGN